MDKLTEIVPAIMACWHPPERTGGMAVVARFSLRKDGSLLGPPTLIAPVMSTDAGTSQAFQASVQDVFARCTPMQLSEGLGAPSPARCSRYAPRSA